MGNAICQNRLRDLATVESDKEKLILEIDALRQVIEEQAESLEAASLAEQHGDRQPSTHLIPNLVNEPSDKDMHMHIEDLQLKISELNRLVMDKDKEIKDLNQILRSKDLGL